MNTNRKADLSGIGFKVKTDDYFADNQRAFSVPDYTTFEPMHQCPGCAARELRLRQMENICRGLAEHIDRAEGWL